MESSPVKQRTLAVRPWTSDDDAFVAELSEESFGEYDVRPSRYLLHATRRHGIRTWIAVENDVPAGMLVLGRDASTWWVLAVAVTARARARGIGGRLMHLAERHASAHGAQRLSLFTADSNLAALDLFLRCGFRIVRRQPRFYARGQDACRLDKQLGSLGDD
ncbi:MAG TPA: GNAT family N-acetyltransferase [Polyangiaceae bacterium]|nr:GNAT family N-acetyltransferase [Polyangiaceae bacterium]